MLLMLEKLVILLLTTWPPTWLITSNDIDYRLPKTVVPLRYNVSLETHMYSDPPCFTGNATIESIAIVAARNITLHAVDLNLSLSNLIVLNKEGRIVEQEEPVWDKDRDFYVINLKNEKLVVDDNYVIQVTNYTGLLHLDNAGFYLAKYHDFGGVEHRIATTQFSSIGARRTYPSFDEPSFKAAYNIQLKHFNNYSSFSNQKQLSSNNDGISTTDEYLELPPVPSYAVALIVTDFIWTYDPDDRVPMKIIARPDAVFNGQGDYALEIGAKIIEITSSFLKLEYPLPKLDHIAIPDEYFAPGAMENWGLITYKESYLLYEKLFCTTEDFQKTTAVMAHETSHQWFGDLVTCDYWNSLWLNEGFATYFEYYTVNLLEPSWRMWDQFVLTSVQYAMSLDYSPKTKPINYATIPPGEGPPGWVAYQKGASILRMIENFVTPEVFRSALNQYLTELSYKTAESEDLYRFLQKVVDDRKLNHLLGNWTVAEILSTWELQAGYPVLNVIIEDSSIILTQTTFPPETSNSTYRWHIPVNFACIGDDFSDTGAEIWFSSEKMEYSQKLCINDSWVLVNKKITGFYRANYEMKNWERIILYLNSDDFSKIDVSNRAQLIDDAFNLARWMMLTYDTPLNLSRFLSRETDYVPWYSFLSVIDFLNYILVSSDCYVKLKEYVFDLSKEVLSRLGYDENPSQDSHTDKLNRNNLLKYLCSLEHKGCLENSNEKFLQWQMEDIAVPPDLQPAVFCGAMKLANDTQWQFLYDIYRNTSQYKHTYRMRILYGLSCTKNETLLNRYLDEIYADKNNTIQSKDKAVQYIYSSDAVGLNVAFDYLMENYEKTQNLSFTTLLNGISERLTLQSQVDKLQQFATERNLTGDLESGIGLARQNVKWIDSVVDDISKWLSDNVV